MTYDPKNVSVVFTDSTGKPQVVTGLDSEIFKPPKWTEEEEYETAQNLLDELNVALVNFPFKIPFSYHVEVAVEEILQNAYKNKLHSFKTLPRVHINTKTRLFGCTMVNALEELKRGDRK